MAINEQMEMAFNNQAPQVDPVSGNEIPPGSLPEEVRDDIDARLSEGEYVVPADVVRYFGVKYFEDLRTEAKLGLSGMEADGRIGGEPMAVDPSGMPPEGMDISEEDIAALEQALTTGVANGGLMDKMARVAKYDPLVNARMNAGGLIVGFAEGGGAVQSLYNDPTRIDALIQKVTAAAQSNPSLMGELAKRGVSVNTTQANMDPNAMQQANNQVQAFAPGGDVSPTFNAASFPLGFSTFGPSAPGMEGVTTQVAYYNPTTGENRSFAHYSSTNTPAEPIPAGFILGTAPVTSAAGVQSAVASGQNISSGGNDNDGPALPPPDPDGWVKKYDYSDPNALTATLMDSIDDKEAGWQKTLTAGPLTHFIGNQIYLDKARQVNTNIEWLKSIGDTKNAKKLKDQLNIYIADREVTGDITGGSYSIDSIIENGNVTVKPIPKPKPAPKAEPITTAAAPPPVVSGITANNNNNDGGNSSSGLANHQQIASVARQEGATAGQAGRIAAKSVTKNLTSKEKKGGAGLDSSYGISGLNKGGLMKKKK